MTVPGSLIASVCPPDITTTFPSFVFHLKLMSLSRDCGTLKFIKVSNAIIRGKKSIDPKGFHIMISMSRNIRIFDMNLQAPLDIPNTDGIHMSKSDIVKISKIVVATGDDRVSMIHGSTNISLKKVICGPSHGFRLLVQTGMRRLWFMLIDQGRLPKGALVPVTLKVLEYELFNFCPLKEITTNNSFAPIGLLDMFNGTGVVDQFEVQMTSGKKPQLFDGDVSSELTSLNENRSPTATITLKVRGCGRFGAYSSQRPLKCIVDNSEADFVYDSATGLVTLSQPVPQD